jgi:hypothetical protein
VPQASREIDAVRVVDDGASYKVDVEDVSLRALPVRPMAPLVQVQQADLWDAMLGGSAKRALQSLKFVNPFRPGNDRLIDDRQTRREGEGSSYASQSRTPSGEGVA